MKPEIILFDLDDTLISFDGVGDPAWKEVCGAYAERTGLFDAHTLFRTIKEVKRWYWGDPERHREGRYNLLRARREVVKLAFQKLGLCDDECAVSLADDYTALQTEMLYVLPGAEETLDKLRSMGIRLALVTNGTTETQRDKINRFDLGKYFEEVFIEEEVGFGKPDTRMFEVVLQRLAASPAAVWMVGDNLEWDVAAPQKLGIYSVWNDYRGAGLPEGSGVTPDRIVNSIEELPELIRADRF